MIRTNAGLLRHTALAVACCALLASAAPGAQVQGSLAFVEVNVIPMDSERVLTRHTVILQGDRIVAIEPADEASIPRGTRRIEARGRYLVPGLVDAHTGILSGRRIPEEFADAELAVMVANGVTTWRSATGTPALLQLRERITETEIVAPSLYVSSPLLTSLDAEPHDARTVTTPFEAAAAIREFKRDGYDFASLSADLGADIYQGVVLTARGSGLRLVGQVPPSVGLQRALEAGQHISHLSGYLQAMRGAEAAPFDQSLTEPRQRDAWRGIDQVDEGRIGEVVRATVDAAVWNTPTLAAFEATFGSQRVDADVEDAPDSRFVSPRVQQRLRATYERFWADPPAPALRRRFVELRQRLVREIYRAGGNLLVGSGALDSAALYGFGTHREMQAMVAAGLPPFAALAAATRSPAAFLSSGGGGRRTEFATVDEGAIRFEASTSDAVEFGGIGVGQRADLVLLRGNPLDDIGNAQEIEGVVLRGRWLPREELDTLLEGAAAALSGAPPLGGS